MKIIDISMEIKEDMLIFPNNPIPVIEQYASIPRNGTNESLITIGSHTGTHVDSPSHIDNSGEPSMKIPMESFYGKCRILDLTGAGKEIHKEHLVKHKIIENEIILLKTENSLKQYKTFRSDFAHIKIDAAEYLVKQKTKTLGVDYLSVKKFHAEKEVHETLINNLTLFEGLYLKNVKPGNYTFIGLPLKINSDGAPARAILIEE